MTSAWVLVVAVLVLLGIWRLVHDGVEFGIIVIGLLFILAVLLTAVPLHF